MNRFASKSTSSGLRGFLLSSAVFVLLLLLFLFGVRSFSGSTDQELQDNLSAALQRAVVRCYATQGFYPPSLDYLKEHYGILYDAEKFLVDYRPVGENIMPDVTVILKQ